MEYDLDENINDALLFFDDSTTAFHSSINIRVCMVLFKLKIGFLSRDKNLYTLILSHSP